MKKNLLAELFERKFFDKKNVLFRFINTFQVAHLLYSQIMSVCTFQYRSQDIHIIICFIAFIAQGTVDYNLGPDRLADSKALDPNHCRQPTLFLQSTSLSLLCQTLDLSVSFLLFSLVHTHTHTHTHTRAHIDTSTHINTKKTQIHIQTKTQTKHIYTDL